MNLKALVLAIILALSVSAQALAQERTIWRVGVFDGSSGEFADGEPRQPVNFAAGHDQARTEWYAFAPVLMTGQPEGPATAPRSIDFSIAGRQGLAYRLRLSLLIEHSSVPALRVQINGRTGTFYLHPKLDYNMGDMVAAFYPAYGRAEVEFDFAGSWLKPGKNSISLQAVSTLDKGVPDAGFDYDAVELQQIETSLRQSGRTQSRPFSIRSTAHRWKSEWTSSCATGSARDPGECSLPWEAAPSAILCGEIRTLEKSASVSMFPSSRATLARK
jgi:hypothetical protein